MRIRLEPAGHEKFKIVLPNKNADYPIGVVWKDSLKSSGWRIKAFFMTLRSDDYIVDRLYDDCLSASRKLAVLFDQVSGHQKSDSVDFAYLFLDDAASD